MLGIKSDLSSVLFASLFFALPLVVFEAFRRATWRNYKPLFLVSLLALTTVGPSLADEEMDESARRCIPTRNLTSTTVIDNRNIVFFMIGEPIYHNILADNCIGLTQRGYFTYDVKLGSLCRGERIVLASVYFAPGRTCEIGYFYRITREELEALRAGSQGAPPPKPLPSAEVEDISKTPDEPHEPE